MKTIMARVDALERRTKGVPADVLAKVEDIRNNLDQLEADAALVRVPLSYSQMLYTLRQHIRLVREKFGAGRRDSSSDAPGLDGPQ